MIRNGRIKGLDGLRGVAILLVLAYHTWTESSGLAALGEGPFFLSLLYAGSTGVTLFFALSGFLVGRPFIEAMRERRPLPSLGRYASQRALRILPTYYVVALLGVLLTSRYDQLVPALTLTAQAYDVGQFSTVWWSLGTEVQFYVLLPLAFLLMARLPGIAGIVVLAVVSGFVYWSVATKAWSGINAEFGTQYRLILSVLGQLPAFLAGMVVFLALPSGRARLPEPLARLLTGTMLVVLMVVLLPAAQVGPRSHIWTAPWYVVPEALVWGAIMWIAVVRAGETETLLDNRLTRYFGQISFPLYLVHMPVIHGVMDHTDLPLGSTVALALAFSLLAAYLLHRLVEAPFLSLKRKLTPVPA
ncbi:acyltransferase family protein [Pseudomonas indica]|uniref:acyltransferase family protein n=1 Tax=Pseudomonas indica TaxID=137658 RepID=UPI0023F8CA19|nr:acyltransferase [Pseudomonas indica]MBU3057784.1 acyltransferase [Pseudomonas indica]